MKRLEYSAEARADLDAIADYYEDLSPSYGERTISDIVSRCGTLRAHPLIGRSRDEFGTGIRSFSAGEYVIYFRKTPRGVEIVRILHGARDVSPDDFA